jgi:hypothetical protein
MPSLEERLQRVESEVDRLRPSLHERLERLEKIASRADRPEPPRSPWRRAAGALQRFFAWMGAELPKFLTAFVLAWFGWGIKDSVDLSIKQRQLDLSYAKEMQGLLQKMGDKDAEMTQLESTAVVLASFGEAALPPLLSELRYSGLRADAAAAGMQALALTRPEAVCAALPRVLSNRARQYDWQAQLKVVRMLGANGCVEAEAPLAAYRAVVAAAEKGSTTAFEEIVRELPLSPAEDYPRILAEVDRSRQMLKH